MFAVRALGLFNEAEALGAVCNFQSGDVPPYLMPYMTIAGEMTPKAPDEMLSDPTADVTSLTLGSLVSWLRLAKAASSLKRPCRTMYPRLSFTGKA